MSDYGARRRRTFIFNARTRVGVAQPVLFQGGLATFRLDDDRWNQTRMVEVAVGGMSDPRLAARDSSVSGSGDLSSVSGAMMPASSAPS